MSSSGIVISGCVRELVGGHIDRGCTLSARRKGCGINRGAGGSKVTDRTTGYGDVSCCKVGGRFIRGKGDGKCCVIGGCAIGNGGAATVGGSNGHGRTGNIWSGFQIVHAHMARAIATTIISTSTNSHAVS